MLEDYVDVAERISLFYAKFPDGRLVADGEPYVMELGATQDALGRQYVVYRALAYRTPDDALPAPGTAWEPWPGPTQFTKDSELMNAETAAIGRAIVMAGIPSKKIASQEEVQARSGQTVEAARPKIPERYEDCLWMAVKFHDADEAKKGEPSWRESFAAATAGDEKRKLIAQLEALLVDVGGDPKLVEERWSKALAAA